MSALARRRRQAEGETLEIELLGTALVLDPSGILFLPDEQCLVVSDLHLEKGAAHARRGMMLPPYDTLETLQLLNSSLHRHQPRRVICLGDSFHDRPGAAMMAGPGRERLEAMMKGIEWLWITGNHDPDAPTGFSGDTASETRIKALTFRHEPGAGPNRGEIAGHLHPVAKIGSRGHRGRHACFASDGTRMILPSFGVTTGGLSVHHKAFSGLFDPQRACAYVIGLSAIYPIGFDALSR